MRNKILSFAFCFAIFNSSFGQDNNFRKGYLRVRSQGNAYTRLAADSVMHIPLKTSLTLNDNDLSPQVFVKDSVLYYTVGNTFKVASSGAGSTFSGSYSDLANKPTIPAAQVQADWNASSGINAIANKPTIPTVPTFKTINGNPITGTGDITITGSGGGSYVPPSNYSFTSTGSPTITLPYAYVSGSVSVYENGMLQVNSFTQTSSTVITLNYTPFSGTTFNITYTKQ